MAKHAKRKTAAASSKASAAEAPDPPPAPERKPKRAAVAAAAAAEGIPPPKKNKKERGGTSAGDDAEPGTAAVSEELPVAKRKLRKLENRRVEVVAEPGANVAEFNHALVREDNAARKKKAKKTSKARVDNSKPAEESTYTKPKRKRSIASEPIDGEVGDRLDPFRKKQSGMVCAHKVCVRGLPWHVDENLLRRDFSECGEIDVLVLLTENHDGKIRSKGMAFISFKRKKGMAAALAYDGTEYGGRYIKVGVALEREDRLKFQGKATGKDEKKHVEGKRRGK